MLIFYDLIVLDDDNATTRPHKERRQILEKVVTVIPGVSGIVEREIIDFSRPQSKEQLQEAFARSIRYRWEGLVLKPCDELYFQAPRSDKDFVGVWIKLKKDLIAGMGDTADFAIVGASYDVNDAQKMKNLKGLNWTEFQIAVLENKSDVQRFRRTPRYRVVDKVHRYGMSEAIMATLNTYGKFKQIPYSDTDASAHVGYDIEHRNLRFAEPEVLFKDPFVVEVFGAGFDKNGSSDFYIIRFPRIKKIHSDRSATEVIGFDELQEQAVEAIKVLNEPASQEEARWLEKLQAGQDVREEQSQSTVASTGSNALTVRSPVSVRTGTKRISAPAMIRIDTSELQAENDKANSESSKQLPFTYNPDTVDTGASPQSLNAGTTKVQNQASTVIKTQHALQETSGQHLNTKMATNKALSPSPSQQSTSPQSSPSLPHLRPAKRSKTTTQTSHCLPTPPTSSAPSVAPISENPPRKRRIMNAREAMKKSLASMKAESSRSYMSSASNRLPKILNLPHDVYDELNIQFINETLRNAPALLGSFIFGDDKHKKILERTLKGLQGSYNFTFSPSTFLESLNIEVDLGYVGDFNDDMDELNHYLRNQLRDYRASGDLFGMADAMHDEAGTTRFVFIENDTDADIKSAWLDVMRLTNRLSMAVHEGYHRKLLKPDDELSVPDHGTIYFLNWRILEIIQQAGGEDLHEGHNYELPEACWMAILKWDLRDVSTLEGEVFIAKPWCYLKTASLHNDEKWVPFEARRAGEFAGLDSVPANAKVLGQLATLSAAKHAEAVAEEEKLQFLAKAKMAAEKAAVLAAARKGKKVNTS